MKYLLILFYTLFLMSCRNIQNSANTNQQHFDSTRSDIIGIVNGISLDSSDTIGIPNAISRHLSACLPDQWTAREERVEDQKTYLAHIGKGIFDLHFRANYELEDTLLGENYNGKIVRKYYPNGRKYYPEIILHFFNNSEEVKESVKFTKENPALISDLKFAEYFGETNEFIIYECSTEKQSFLPRDPKIVELRKCLIEKITTYNRVDGLTT